MNELNSKSEMFTEKEISEIFNSMSEDYDNLYNLWCSWVSLQIDIQILDTLEELKRKGNIPHNCLDVGCGTGLQSFLFRECGIDVVGIDLSEELINIAKKKISGSYVFEEEINKRSKDFREETEIGNVFFTTASAKQIPFNDNSFDIINCCGNVLNFIDDYNLVLSEMYRVLKPKGHLILEVDNKYNFDIIWPIIDCLCLGKLKYNQSLSKGISNIFSKPNKHININFPFLTSDNNHIDFKLRLFSSIELKKELKLNKFNIKSVRGIHFITNLIPSTVLCNPNPSLFTKKLFDILSKIDPFLCKLSGIRNFGCSTIYVCRKTDFPKI
jgi:ubiquinone/menaquinone biosynthesis C-methylase UbiE